MLAPIFTVRVVEAFLALLGAPLCFWANKASRGDWIFTAAGVWHLTYSFVCMTINCMNGLEPYSTPVLWAWIFDHIFDP
jgi:hypothetical protein